MKACTSCHEVKPEGEFYKGHGRCKDCHKAGVREWRTANPDKVREYDRRYKSKNPDQHRKYRLEKYGLTQEDFDAILATQGGMCRICFAPEPGGRGQWHIDHDHSCCPGEGSCGNCVRGLLCFNCNTAIGLLHDDVERLQRALDYLSGELG